MRGWGCYTDITFSLFILPRSAKSGHVYARGTFNLGSGEETFWSQQEEDGRETEGLWFWGKDEGAQRRSKALLFFHLSSPSFEFYVTNHGEAFFLIPLPPPEDSCILNLYWEKHLLRLFGTLMILRICKLTFFPWTLWAYSLRGMWNQAD